MSVCPPGLAARVSRETRQRLEIIVRQIEKWQPRINLVSPSSLPAIWERHVGDSLQLVDLAQDVKRWLDLGSGGGFPGLVVAASMAEKADFLMVLVESSAKKSAFLRETARLATLPVEVQHKRIEDFAAQESEPFDIVSARALAPLSLLLDLAEPFLAAGAVGLFPKGQDVEGEIITASKTWHLESDLIQSRTEPHASILRIRLARRRSAVGPDQTRG